MSYQFSVDRPYASARRLTPQSNRRPPGAADMTTEAYRMRQLRAAIAARLERGDTLDTVERQLIAPARLSDEQRSALWLYAWSLPKRPAASEPRLPVWVALANALATLVGIYRY
jgi:hypothetical protein